MPGVVGLDDVAGVGEGREKVGHLDTWVTAHLLKSTIERIVDLIRRIIWLKDGNASG